MATEIELQSGMVNIGGIVYTIVKSSPVIEAEASNKKRKFWQGHILRSPAGKFSTASSACRETTTGLSKVVWSEPYYAEEKNIGRSNETTNEQQAQLEFDSMVALQTRKRAGDRPMPMLAATYLHKTEPKKSRKHKIRFPALIQRKYDGKRMLTDGEVGWSRGNKEQNPETVAHILPIDTKGLILDGELLLPTNEKVGDVMSAINKFQDGISDQLIYVVYDIVDYEKPYWERLEILRKFIADLNHPNVIRAETLDVHNEADILGYHALFTNEGYEGSIIRNTDVPYVSKRTDDLQKHKDFIDEEFEIVDVIPSGGGSAAEVGKFVCKSPPGAREETFESTATGKLEQRKEYLRNKQNYIGKFAKVKYRELTKYGTPFHSNVLEIRDTKSEGH